MIHSGLLHSTYIYACTCPYKAFLTPKILGYPSFHLLLFPHFLTRTQHVLLLCVISHHILYYDSLKTLQQRLNYQFHDPTLLHQALTHPSCTITSFVVAEDHLRSALSNCGLKMPEFIKSTLSSGGKATRSVMELKKAVMMDKKDVDESQRPQNNEQLEFLGDAVIEYICRYCGTVCIAHMIFREQAALKCTY